MALKSILTTIFLLIICTINANVFLHRKQRKSQVFSPIIRSKPNIVLILTDDQDVELGSLNFMPKTLKNIRDHGAEFRHAYVTTPMCCPSRSSLLTGMYVHNHYVYTNNDNCSSAQWQATHETRTFATYLSNAGYRTGYFGKYLNKYNGSYIPPGWREWGGLIMNSKYYNYSINMNGKKIKHGFDYHKDYYSDLIANDSIAFLRHSKKQYQYKPIMLTMSFPAPHGPEDSAPQFSHLFFNVSSHHTPSYDHAPNPDKQWILQITKNMAPIHREFTDLLMTKRLQTLQSVDDAVQKVVKELDDLGELENTYIIYTSDHGYHLGQFGLVKGKSFPFEFDVRVPFLVRGPGVEPGTIINDIVLNIDLAPTFLDMAGVEPPPHMDGKSVLPLFHTTKRKKIKWPDTFLIESSGRREVPHPDKIKQKQSLTNVSYLTTEHPLNINKLPVISTTETLKVYESSEDLSIDSANEDDDENEEDNRRGIEVTEEEEEDSEERTNVDNLKMALNNLKNEGEFVNLDNRLTPVLSSKLERLTVECLRQDMKFPCQKGQKWFCENDSGKWRKRKCKFVNQYNQNPSNINDNKKCNCSNLNSGKRIKRYLNDSGLEEDFNGNVTRLSRDENQREERDLNNGTNLQNGSSLISSSLNNFRKPSCLVQRGKINCSNDIYKDKKTWRLSRNRIDNEIQELKHKLETLKEIRRHLKNSRPSNGTDLNAFNDLTSFRRDNASDNTDINRFRFNVKKKKRRPFYVKNTSENPFTITTPSSGLLSNHHRHKHTQKIPAMTTIGPKRTQPKVSDLIPLPRKRVKPNWCECETEEKDTEQDIINKKRSRDEKLRKKLRKLRKKEQLMKECGHERMNCFHHDNEHWKTAPLWNKGPFCFCMNANNNTYSCIRTINATHNFLYCEFTTGFITFYNLRIDPFELQNRADSLKPQEKIYLHDLLLRLMGCKGKSCTVSHHIKTRTRNNNNSQQNTWKTINRDDNFTDYEESPHRKRRKT